MTTIVPTGYSQDYVYAEEWARVCAPGLARAMHWPEPRHASPDEDMEGSDTFFGSHSVDWKFRRQRYYETFPEDPDVVLEPPCVGSADWLCFVWPSDATATFYLVSRADAQHWLRKNAPALDRLKRTSSSGTIFYPIRRSLLEATLPRGKALVVSDPLAVNHRPGVYFRPC